MTAKAGSGTHIDHELLGLHFMDALDPAESDVVHGHLQVCGACSALADEVCDTVAALALLGTDEAVVPSRTRPEPVAAASPSPRRPTRSRPVDGPVQPVRRGGSTRPGPSRGRSSRARKLLQVGVLLALVLFLAGLGLTTLLGSPQGTSTPMTTAAAVATDETTGASMSVIVSSDESDGSIITATVRGLRPGVPYILHAVASDGETREVTTWTGTPNVQTVSGWLPVRLVDLSFFTVSFVNGGPVVSVYLPGTQTAPTR